MSADNQTADPLLDDVAATVGAAVEGEHIAAADAPAEMSADDKALAEVYMLLRVTTDKLAPAWQVADEECAAIATAAVPVLQKYGVGSLPIEISLLLAVAMVVYPRWGTPLKNPPPQDETDKPSTPAS